MQDNLYEACPVARSIQLIGDRWALLIVRDAFDGITRFSDFQKSLNVARNILSDRLKKLLEAKILQVRPASDGSAYQEYILTRQGLALFPIIVGLRQWGEQFLFSEQEPHSKLIDIKTGLELAPMVPINQDGNAVSSKDTQVKKIKG